MGVGFLTNFMRFAQATTRAERSMALDLDMNIHDSMNIDDGLLNEEDFAGLLRTAIDEAINTDDVVITNNLINDPDDAPKTNVHLHELRMVVAIPVRGHGAVYLDQRIRSGVFPRDLVEKLTEFGRYLVDNDKTDLNPSEYTELFEN